MHQDTVLLAGNTSTLTYEPYVLDGETVAEVHWLRRSKDGEPTLQAGVWRCQPRTISHRYLVNETFLVLEGEVHIETPNGSLAMTPGDMASIPVGAATHWTIVAPCTKFFVVSE